MMKPEYAACVAAILLTGRAPDSGSENDQNGIADQFIKICDPKTQTVFHSCWHDSKFTRGCQSYRFFVHQGRNVSASFEGQGYIDCRAERADPNDPNCTWWMLL